MVALPFWPTALDTHPATRRSVKTLRGAGVRVLHGEGEWQPHAPGTGGERRHLALDVLSPQER
ncbi:hypothetical protein GCM10010219_54640 [Streptomyces netropsis]|nr:hypothetical protein GCM10010219_54640 [Streptomyces netropsis]